MKRVGIFGWGVVAPNSANIEAFSKNLKQANSWLSPFNGFGPDNFLVGKPDFDFLAYKDWIDQRFPPNRYRQLTDKMDHPSLFAIAAFIQSLAQNPGIENELQTLGTQAHVYIGTGLGNLPTLSRETLNLDKAQRAWNRFWGDPSRNQKLQDHLSDPTAQDIPVSNPEQAAPSERALVEDDWYAYWTEQSVELQDYLQELADIESLIVEGDVEKEKINVMKEKQRRKIKLQNKWQAPTPPWEAVSANVVWNISNTPAAQVSMLGKITGLAFAPVAACSTFGVTLKLAIDTIQRGEAKLVVIGATDPPPQPLLVGAFYKARVASGNGQVSKPLAELRGTHVAGGSVVWIVGDYEYMKAKGYKPLGLEPLAVGVSSDADHIITPSKEGPQTAIQQALDLAKINPDDVTLWDMHATATPGDYSEIETLHQAVSQHVLITARKGTFGHGMSAGGGWELTAQYLGYEEGMVFPTALKQNELNSEIGHKHQNFVFDTGCQTPKGIAGKMSTGVGGINACVLARPW